MTMPHEYYFILLLVCTVPALLIVAYCQCTVLCVCAPMLVYSCIILHVYTYNAIVCMRMSY